MRQAERTGRGALVVVTGDNPLGGGPPMFDMARMRRRVGGIFVCAAVAVAAALGGHLLLRNVSYSLVRHRSQTRDASERSDLDGPTILSRSRAFSSVAAN